MSPDASRARTSIIPAMASETSPIPCRSSPGCGPRPTRVASCSCTRIAWPGPPCAALARCGCASAAPARTPASSRCRSVVADPSAATDIPEAVRDAPGVSPPSRAASTPSPAPVPEPGPSEARGSYVSSVRHELGPIIGDSTFAACSEVKPISRRTL